MGCPECTTDYPEWRETKHCYQSYLLDSEKKTAKKIRQLKKFIKSCLGAGFSEINWEWLHNAGHLCKNDYDLFDELKGYDPDEYEKKNNLVP